MSKSMIHTHFNNLLGDCDITLIRSVLLTLESNKHGKCLINEIQQNLGRDFQIIPTIYMLPGTITPNFVANFCAVASIGTTKKSAIAGLYDLIILELKNYCNWRIEQSKIDEQKEQTEELALMSCLSSFALLWNNDRTKLYNFCSQNQGTEPIMYTQNHSYTLHKTRRVQFGGSNNGKGNEQLMQWNPYDYVKIFVSRPNSVPFNKLYTVKRTTIDFFLTKIQGVDLKLGKLHYVVETPNDVIAIMSYMMAHLWDSGNYKDNDVTHINIQNWIKGHKLLHAEHVKRLVNMGSFKAKPNLLDRKSKVRLLFALFTDVMHDNAPQSSYAKATQAKGQGLMSWLGGYFAWIVDGVTNRIANSATRAICGAMADKISTAMSTILKVIMDAYQTLIQPIIQKVKSICTRDVAKKILSTLFVVAAYVVVHKMIEKFFPSYARLIFKTIMAAILSQWGMAFSEELMDFISPKDKEIKDEDFHTISMSDTEYSEHEILEEADGQAGAAILPGIISVVSMALLGSCDIKKVAALSTTIRCGKEVSVIIEFIINNFKLLIDMAYCAKEGKPFFTESVKIEEVRKVMDEYSALMLNPDAGDIFRRNAQLADQIIELYQKLLKMDVEVRTLKCLGPMESTRWTSMMISMRYWYNNACATKQTQKPRIVPLWVSLVGAPGVGKSTAINYLISALYNATHDDKYDKSMRFERKSENEFWDGYNGQYCTTIDDLYQTLDITLRTETSMTLIHAVNSNVFPLHMSQIKDKAGTNFTSDLLVTTSNELSMPTNLGITDGKALLRRCHVPILMHKKGDFADVKDKYSVINCWEFEVLESFGSSTPLFERPLTFGELVSYCVEQRQKLVAASALLNDPPDDLVIELDKIDLKPYVKNEPKKGKFEIRASNGKQAKFLKQKDGVFKMAPDPEPIPIPPVKDNFPPLQAMMPRKRNRNRTPKPVKGQMKSEDSDSEEEPCELDSDGDEFDIISDYESSEEEQTWYGYFSSKYGKVKKAIFGKNMTPPTYTFSHSLGVEDGSYEQCKAKRVKAHTLKVDRSGIINQFRDFCTRSDLNTLWEPNAKHIVFLLANPNQISALHQLRYWSGASEWLVQLPLWKRFIVADNMGLSKKLFITEYDKECYKQCIKELLETPEDIGGPVDFGTYEVDINNYVYNEYKIHNKKSTKAIISVEEARYKSFVKTPLYLATVVVSTVSLSLVAWKIFSVIVKNAYGQSMDRRLERNIIRTRRGDGTKKVGHQQRGNYKRSGGIWGQADVEEVDGQYGTLEVNQMANALALNTEEATFVYANGESVKAFIFFVKGTIGFTARHIFDGKEPVIQISFAAKPGMPGSSNFLKGQFRATKFEDRDMARVVFDASCRSHKDLSKHLMPFIEDSIVENPCRVEFEIDKELERRYYVIGNYARAIKGAIRTNYNVQGEQKSYVSKSYWDVDRCEGFAGACGFPYMDATPSRQKPIFGIHTAGLGDRSIVMPIWEQDLEDDFYAQAGLSTPIHPFKDEKVILMPGDTDEYPQGTPIYDFNVVPYIKGTRFEGHLERKPYIPMKSNIIPTPIQTGILDIDTGVTLECPVPVTGAPAQLSSTDKPTPLDIAYKKFGEVTTPALPEIVREIMTDERIMDGVLTESRNRKRRRLTFDEAVLGVPELGIPPMDLTTSPGFPFTMNNMKTSELLQVVEEAKGKKRVVVHKKFQELFEWRVTNMENGVMVPYTVNDTLKDEVRDLERVRQKKTRLFDAGPKVDVVKIRMMLGHLVAHIEKDRNHSDIKVGINPHGPEWAMFYDKMCKHLRSRSDPGSLGGDADRWDKSMLLFCSSIIATFMIRYCGYEMTEKEKTWTHCMVRSYFTAMHISPMGVYFVERGGSSGHALTSIFNSIVNSIYHRTAYACLVPLDLRWTFDVYVVLGVYGDDSAGSVSPVVRKWYNMVALKDFFGRYFSLGYTTSSKGAIEAPFITMEDLEFLKRKFTLHTMGDKTMIMPALSMDSIHSSFLWKEKKGTQLEQLEALRQSCDSAMHEAFYHGEKVYHELYTMLKPRMDILLQKPGTKFKSYYMPTYQKMYDKYIHDLPVN